MYFPISYGKSTIYEAKVENVENLKAIRKIAYVKDQDFQHYALPVSPPKNL